MKRWIQPIRREVSVGIGVSLLAGVMTALLLSSLAQPYLLRSGAEAERLAVYWSSFAGQYAALHHSREGIETALREAAASYPSHNEAFSVVIRDYAGKQLASVSSGECDGRSASRSSKPYLSNRTIGGTVEACHNNLSWTSARAHSLLAGAGAAAIAAGSFCFHAWLYRRRLKGMSMQALSLLPQEGALGITEAASLSTHESFSRMSEGESMLAAHLEQAAGYIQHLNNIRKPMVAEVAHELRTPLAIIRATIDNALYEQRALEGQALSILSDQARAMSRLVQDLQDLSLAESGRLALDKAFFDPGLTAQQLVELLGPDAEEKGISITLQADNPVHLYGDEKRIRQLLLNLMGNALTHARTAITVRVAASDNEMRLEVEDDGWGLEEEESPHLFDRYYRKKTYADGSPTPRGSGLGLAVVKGIAEAHGGSASVSSRFGDGACFSITLPVFRE